MTNREDSASGHQASLEDPAGTTPAKRVALALTASGLAAEIDARDGVISPNAHVVLERRYLSKDKTGNILEDADGMFERVSHNLSLADLNYGANEEERAQTQAEFARVMRSLEVLPNSPTLMNAGRELQQLSACFVLPVDDSLDDIFDGVKRTALIHKSGGGTGFSFSRLRPEGAVVGSTGGVASGPVSFIRAFDTATDVVKQGGTRRGANMGILLVTHPDIMKFIHCKEDGLNLQNFNISVAATDDFMSRAKNNQDYTLHDPTDGHVTSTLNAKEVFDEMVKMAWLTGDPGLVFIDQINRGNPNPQLGIIESTNPCGEQPLQPYESCNLASINLGRMTTFRNGVAELDEERLAETVAITVHMLDNVIDMNRYPIPEIENMTKKTRRIGLGVMGLADMLVHMGVQYDSEEALKVTRTVMSKIRLLTHRASTDLAAARDSFPEWEESIYGPQLGDGVPMRNSAPTTIAPTGTISIIAGASSGIEPLFALAYVRNVMDNTKLTEGNPALEAVARSEGFYSLDFMNQVAQHGTLQHLDVPQWVKDIFRTSHEIAPQWHVRMQAAAQENVDNAVSKTINFPASATIEDVANAYMMAYDLGCKGITVYRDGSKENQVLSAGQNLPAVTAEINSPHEPAAETHHTVGPRHRPRNMPGVTQRVSTGHGHMYVTINYDEQGLPFEVFGNLGKAGGCDSAQLEAITRLASLAFRSNVDVREVIDQLKGITCCPAWDEGYMVKSSPDAVALVLERELANGQGPNPAILQLKFNTDGGPQVSPYGTNASRCPDCANPAIYKEGCLTCEHCGWSRCE